jgi:N-acetyl-anhydromuramyl-L-alanine amidase AmpD
MEQKILLKSEDVKYLIIHHSATLRDYTTFKSVREYHINQRGFWEIGYHYFIDGKGNLYNGRPTNYVGAHTSADNMNFKSLGICLAGNFEEEEPSREQLVTLEDLLKNLCKIYKIQKDNVLGHRQVKGAATLCPGIHLLVWLDEWKAKKNDGVSFKDELIEKLTKIRDEIDQVISKLKES